MAKQITITAYTFDELSDKAKDKARERHRDMNVIGDWWDSTYEDADLIAELMGIDIDRDAIRKRDGSIVPGGPDIQFSGFARQGDGLSFTGAWTPKEGGAAAVREHAPLDERLHGIADTLEALGKAIGPNMRATMKRNGHQHSHEYTVSIELEDMDETTESDPRGTDQQQKDVADALRSYMKWIYRQLEQEYEYLTGDEAVDETIQANEYLFTEDGSRTAVLN